MLKCKRSVAMVVGVLWTISSAFGGAEIGNAYKAYFNGIGRYAIAYPESWAYIEMNDSISFFDGSRGGSRDGTLDGLKDKKSNPYLAVREKTFPNVNTVPALLDQIRFFHPGEVWIPIAIGGRFGFQTNTQNEGVIYLLKSPEQVLSLRFDSVNKEGAIEKIQVMLNSLQVF